MDAKWFWGNASSAERFMERYPDLSHIVEVSVPEKALDIGMRVPNQDTLGPAVNFIDEALDQFNAAIIRISIYFSK